MKVLIVGAGRHDRVLAWKVMQSPRLSQLFVAPGNAGTAANNVAIGAEDIPALVEFANEQAIDLTIIGPEAPLALGLARLITPA